jgi:hypothetical protein
VRNISAGGVMAHVYRHFEIGTRLHVEIKNDEAMAGRVVWAEDSNVGIAFDQKIDVPDLLATSKLLGHGRLARRPRVEINRRVRLRCGAEVYFADGIDISQGGVKVATEQKLPVNGDVVVTLDGFRPLPAIVRWVKDGHVGISFLQVIPIGELCEWLRAAAAE